jgi:hypothetical protein
MQAIVELSAARRMFSGLQMVPGAILNSFDAGFDNGAISSIGAMPLLRPPMIPFV